MSSATFYKWRSKFGGMDASMMKQLKELESENKRLKKMYAEAKLGQDRLKEAMAKKWWGHLADARWPKKRLHSNLLAFDFHVCFSQSARHVVAISLFSIQKMSA